MRLYLYLIALTSLLACEQAKAPEPAAALEPALTDSALYAQAMRKSGFVWYKRDSSRFPSTGRSGHPSYERTRYNAIAAAALTEGGKLPVGGQFPDGSIIVKEIFSAATGTGPFETVAIMKKEPSNPSAAKGWLWGEYYPLPTGNYIKIADKGTSCAVSGCHLGSSTRDYTLLFDERP